MRLRRILSASLRWSSSSRSTNRMPSRWSSSCWNTRPSSSVPSIEISFPSRSRPDQVHRIGTHDLPTQPGHGQASFVVDPLAVALDDARIDHRPDPIADVVDEDPPLHSHLVRRQPRPGRGVHGLDHRVDQAGERTVDVLDLAGTLLEHWVAVLANGKAGHGRILPGLSWISCPTPGRLLSLQSQDHHKAYVDRVHFDPEAPSRWPCTRSRRSHNGPWRAGAHQEALLPEIRDRDRSVQTSATAHGASTNAGASVPETRARRDERWERRQPADGHLFVEDRAGSPRRAAARNRMVGHTGLGLHPSPGTPPPRRPTRRPAWTSSASVSSVADSRGASRCKSMSRNDTAAGTTHPVEDSLRPHQDR